MPSPFSESVWAPVAPDRPGGADLAFAPELDEIRAARQGDDAGLAQGEWVQELRAPQWARVVDLCEAILAGRSKDLQVACWYAEALAHTAGFPGLAHGLRTVEVLLDRFWSDCHPALAGPAGPAQAREERIGRIEWLDRNGALAVGRIPLTARTAGGYDLVRWEESRRVDNLGLRDPEAREAAVRAGQLSGEAVRKSAAGSGPAHFQVLAGEIRTAAAACASLRTTLDRRFDPDPPSLAALAGAIDACRNLVDPFLGRPDPCGADPAMPSPGEATAPEVPVPPPARSAPAAPSRTRAGAIRELRDLAGWFRDREPHSPVPALVDRAADWAEMPLARWLATVVKDPAALAQIRELLALDL